jgi:hypothetical protein
MARIKSLLSIACLIVLGLTASAAAQSQQSATSLTVDDLLAIQVYAVGGSLFRFGATGNVGAVDLTGPTSLVTNQSGGSSSATPLFGARVHVPMFWYMRDEQALGFNFFFETGIQSGFAAQSFIQLFQGTSINALDFGTSTVREYFQVPVLLGVTVPIGTGGYGPSPSVLFDIYGGITIDSWSLVLQGAENNAPGQQGFNAENRMYTADPTIGLGMRTPMGTIADFPLFLGINAELQFRPGTSVSAFSNNFAVNYVSSIGPTTNLAVMARIGIAFGGR